jgi:hypothetical protein
MYFVRIDDKVFTLSNTSLKHFTVLNKITTQKDYSNDSSEYIKFDLLTKTFTIDMTPKAFSVMLESIRGNEEDVDNLSTTKTTTTNASRVGFKGLNHIGGLQILSEDDNLSSDVNSPELVLTEISDTNHNRLSDPSNIFLKNIKKPSNTNTQSSIGLTDGSSTIGRYTDSFIKPRRFLVNE